MRIAPPLLLCVVAEACTGPFGDRVRPDSPGSPALSVSEAAVTVSWTDRSDAEDGFVIERRMGLGEYTEIGTVLANHTRYTDDSAPDLSEERTYRVYARNGSLRSDPSRPVSLCRPDEDEDTFPGRGPLVSSAGECPFRGKPPDCDDASPDVGSELVYFRDSDTDAQGGDSETLSACAPPPGYVSNAGDCNDSDRAAHWGATERCDRKDNDCDGETDEKLICFPSPAPSFSISANAGQSMRPSLLLDDQGRPIVAWEDDSSGNFEIYVRRWNGSSGLWGEMGPASASAGGLSSTPSASRSPTLALIDGSLLAVWEEWEGSSPTGQLCKGEACLAPTPSSTSKRWHADLNRWATLTAEEALSAWAARPEPGIVATSDDSSGNYEIYVKVKTPEGQWKDLSSSAERGASRTPGQSLGPSAALDAAGNAWVAWEEVVGGRSEIRLSRWDPVSANWISGLESPLAGSRPRLAINSAGQPILAWESDFDGAPDVFVSGFIP